MDNPGPNHSEYRPDPILVDLCPFTHFVTGYNKTARPSSAAPAAPERAVGKAAAAFPVSDPVAEAPAEFIADDAADPMDPASLVALLKRLPASLEALESIDGASLVKDASEDAAPEIPADASELRLARVSERPDSTEPKLSWMDDWTEAMDSPADAADSVIPETADAAELAAADASEATEPRSVVVLSWARPGTAARREKRTRLESCMMEALHRI